MRVFEQLDVRQLDPPEPMVKILAALERLPAGQLLKVAIHRQPHPLFHLLSQDGFQYECSPEQDYFQLKIWRSTQVASL